MYHTFFNKFFIEFVTVLLLASRHVGSDLYNMHWKAES